ncbi:hypothetical protein BsIDN1_41850 [Bacillus safensis]|uniref:CoA carboxyltransferase N-terminal domain-containing protein n=1 Tax=Bacillus safensis TaxID=561879 RepID=A0A5S9MAP3_BACIA|nr:hypothetical protein BsIDN1_41850 [Bacillus safensis]
MNDSFNDLSEWRNKALMGGGEKRAAAHRSKGKLTVRERLHELLDEGSLMEIQSFATGGLSEHVGDGVVVERDSFTVSLSVFMHKMQLYMGAH